jgi:hypothetical protein
MVLQTPTTDFLAPFPYPLLFRAHEPSGPLDIANARPIDRWSRESSVQEVQALDEYEVGYEEVIGKAGGQKQSG